jgi:hypothetical protein
MSEPTRNGEEDDVDSGIVEAPSNGGNRDDGQGSGVTAVPETPVVLEGVLEDPLASVGAEAL